MVVTLILLAWTVLGFGAALLFGRMMRLPNGSPCEEAPKRVRPNPIQAYLS